MRGQVSGLPTNVEFLKRLCAHPAFAACDLDTSFIARHLDALLARTPPSAEVLALAAVTDHLLQVRVRTAPLSTSPLRVPDPLLHNAEVMDTTHTEHSVSHCDHVW